MVAAAIHKTVSAAIKTVSTAFNKVKKQVARTKVLKSIARVFISSPSAETKAKGYSILMKQLAEKVKKNLHAYFCGSAGFLSFDATPDTTAAHTALDVAGFAPVVGVLFDAANGIWYLSEGDAGNAAWSVAALIPVVGDISAAGKAANKVAKAGEAVSDAGKAGKAGNAISDTGKIAIVAGKVEDLPEHARIMFEKYEAAGWRGNVSGQTPGTRAGHEYRNDGRDGTVLLPETGADGQRLEYFEFDINNRIPGQSRDSERFLKVSDGSVYYTNDHYMSVIKVK